MSDELIGYTDEQHREISRVVLDARKWTAPAVGVASSQSLYPGVARVIAHHSDAPTYQPKTTRECAIFELNANGQQKTLEFSGQALEGDLVLTIAGHEVQVDCRTTTSQLRAKLIDAGISAADCRATVFPGLWEFDFNAGRYFEQAPSMSAEAWEPPSDDLDSPVFSGQLKIVDEAWLSVSADGVEPTTIETRDWIPHKSGAIKAGAIGAASWSHEAGWLVLAWQCRDYSFRSGG